MIRTFLNIAIGIVLVSGGLLHGGEPANQPRPLPLTRPDMKQLLEDMKTRKPRIPLPEMTDAEKEKLGERGGGYEGRVRALYMPKGEGRGGIGFSREADPKMTLSYEFKTQLFWI